MKIKNIFFSAILFLYGFHFSYTQDVSLDWALGFGDYTNFDKAKAVVVDSQGSIYHAGLFERNVDFDPSASNLILTATSSPDAYIEKLDKDGNLIWAFDIGIHARIERVDLLSIDDSDNIYAVGTFSNNGTIVCDFNPLGAYTANLDTAFGSKFICKYNTNGHLIWAKSFGGYGNSSVNDMTIDVNGNIILTGYFRQYSTGLINFNTNPNGPFQNLHNGGGKDIFVLKLDSNGNKDWGYAFAGTVDEVGEAVTTDKDGNVYFAGYIDGTADFDFTYYGVTNLTATGTSNDAFLTKLNPNGTIAWAKQIECSNFSTITSLALDKNNNIIVGGKYSGSADFDLSNNTHILLSVGISNFIASYNTLGELNWANTIHTGNHDISLTTNKFGIYATGIFSLTTDFDSSTAVFNLTANGSNDIYNLKLDFQGNFSWVKQISCIYNNNYSYDIFADNLDNVITVGSFRNASDFDPNAGVQTINTNGGNDIFVQKLKPDVFYAPFCDSFEDDLFFSTYWTQDNTDDFDWTRRTGSTPSFYTGPTNAEDGNYYIYTEATPQSASYFASIISPKIDISKIVNPFLEFNYHMYGTGMNPDGNINVYISINNGVTWTSLFNQVGNHGDKWSFFSADLTPYVGNILTFKITGTIASSGPFWENDFAIDNFCIKESSLLEHFVTTWQTDNVGTSNNSSITIPTKNTETYNYDVDWDNDGVFEDKGVTGNIIHDYGVGNEGTKTVRIRGEFPSIFFNGSFDKDKILQVNQWGNQKWTTFNNAFRRCYNLNGNATDTPDLSKVTNMHNTFSYAYNFNGDISNWDTSNITNLRETFNRATSFNQDISSWDVSNVSNMYRTFYIATHFNQNLDNWNIENTSNMDGMLSYSGLSANNYDNTLIGWQNQNVTNNITLGADTLEYCLSEVQRQTLIDTNLWTINGDSKGCDDCSQGLTIWNGTNWSNGTPTLLKSTRLDADYDTAINGSFNSCDCQIIGGVTLNIRNGNYIHANDTHSNGNILIENNGSFTQTSNTATLGGIGYFKLERETTPYTEYDYTYWASPTRFETVSDTFNTNSLLIAGASHVNAVNDDNFSPTNRIYQFNAANFNDNDNDTFDDEGNDWQNVPSNELMTAGKGYIAMGAGADFPFNTNFATGLQQRIFFEGRFNTGNINYTVFTDASPTDSSQNLNLTGNPYPSAIDINLLMKNNLARLGGTFYFWTHDSPISGANPGPHAFDFTNNDYAIATSNGTVFNSVSSGTTGTTPKGYIATAQSVMATVLNQGDIIFTNDIRITSPNASYRPANQPNLDRIWLNLTNTEGTFMQQLITFYENGNPSFENGLDGERPNNANNYDFYSIIDDDSRRFAIQTVDKFNINQTIKLGVEIIDSGIFTISIDQLEGIFLNRQTIFLQDNETQTIHNLSNSDYTFYIHQTEGLNNRFILKFENQTATNEEYLFSNISIYPNPSKNGIFFVSTNKNSKITYSIYNLNGKKLITDKTLNTQNILDLSDFLQGIYIIKLSTNNKQIIRKLIIK